MAYDPSLEFGRFDANGDWIYGRSREQQAQDEARNQRFQDINSRGMNSKQFFALNPQKDNDGFIWAINPATERWERLAYSGQGTNAGLMSHEYGGPDDTARYLWESDPLMAGAGATQFGQNEADRRHFAQRAGLTKMGLAAIAGAGVGGAMSGAGYGTTASGAGAGATAGGSRAAMSGENVGEGALKGGAIGAAGGYLYGSTVPAEAPATTCRQTGLEASRTMKLR
jgi:osmotically inducible lipoprotein OsmB